MKKYYHFSPKGIRNLPKTSKFPIMPNEHKREKHQVIVHSFIVESSNPSVMALIRRMNRP
jgi:hypothetical protein